MTQSKAPLEIDVKWLIGFILTLLGTQAAVFWRVVALYERIATIEAHLQQVENYDVTTRSAARLERIEAQLENLAEITEYNNRRLRGGN